MPPKDKVTVIKREYYQDWADLYLANPNVGKHQVFHDDQEFIIDDKSTFRWFTAFLHGIMGLY